MVLSDLPINGQGVVMGFVETATKRDLTHEKFILRLMEMGLVTGAKVKVLHEAPFFGDPIAVEVEGNVIGLRRAEAAQIEINQVDTSPASTQAEKAKNS